MSLSTPLIPVHSPASLRGCPDCGLVSHLPRARSGFDMRCVRCEKNFRHAHQHSLTWTLACALTGLVFYGVVLSAPFIEVLLYGRMRSSNIMTGIQTLGSDGMWGVAAVIILTTIVFPMARLAGFVVVLVNLHLRHPPQWTVALFRFIKHFHAWAMIEIYLLGTIVAYTRLQALANVHVDTAAFALIGLVLSIAMIVTNLDPEAVWDRMKEKGLVADMPAIPAHNLAGCTVCHQANDADAASCLRCSAPLHARKPNSLSRTWALLMAAGMLYVPANVFPIMEITNLKGTTSYTILRGVQEFIKAGLWPLALLVFVASIMIPLVKLVALAALLWMTERRSSAQLLNRTRLYRFIEFIGRWSMIDIFMLSILVGLMQFGQLAKITPDTGAAYFTAVVILTMFAVMSFDPRLMWDVYRKNNKGSV